MLIITEITTVGEMGIDRIDLQNKNFDYNIKEVINKIVSTDFESLQEEVLCPKGNTKLYH